MKHALIVAHPNPDSLTCAVARAYADAARALGETVVERDLYRMGFDPRLPADEIPGPHTPTFGDDVLRERAMLADADVFAFVYPLWLNAPPAMLKGYVERVFGFGFGYGRAMDSLLAGRKLISFTTSGAPEHWLRDTGALDALRTLFDAHLAGVTGMSILDHVHHGGIAPGITEEAVGDILEDVRAAVKRHFG
ncbi:MAG TPA: NAD(P)H-dependent oxidoreductase [Caulobacteraceae bacterium]